MTGYGPLDKMLKVTEVAELLHVHPNTIKRRSEQGKIRAYRIGFRGDRRFGQNDVADFIAGFEPFKQNERWRPGAGQKYRNAWSIETTKEVHGPE